jgi:uncharacterized protein YbjT (DUF2867 family)
VTRVLVIGGTGFIGRHVAAALTAAGHAVTALGRGGIDLVTTPAPELAVRLAGHDVVVNAAGLVRGRGANSLAAVHAEGTARLARVCAAAGVARLIHISALGADAAGATEYQRTKGRGDDTARGIGVKCCVLRPSLVIGRGGASTVLLCALAALPLSPRLGPGTWTVQPVHVDDLAALVVRLVTMAAPLPPTLDVVGPDPMTTDAVTVALRSWMGLPPRPFLPVPQWLLRVAAVVSEFVTSGPFNREILAMLKAGNTADAGGIAAALGRPPRRLPEALAAHPPCYADRVAARLYLVRPLLRWSLGLLWLVTGLLSLGLYPVAESHRLLGVAGLYGAPADIALGAAVLDIGLGLAMLVRWRPAATGFAALAVMAIFTLIATRLPAEYWLHPFAPLLKNLPIAAATLAMSAMEA